MEDVSFLRIVAQREILRIPSAYELQRHFHYFFAGQFAAGEVGKDLFPVFGEEGFAFRDAGGVAAFELEPPVGFEFCER